jgi:hypothetical protein
MSCAVKPSRLCIRLTFIVCSRLLTISGMYASCFNPLCAMICICLSTVAIMCNQQNHNERHQRSRRTMRNGSAVERLCDRHLPHSPVPAQNRGDMTRHNASVSIRNYHTLRGSLLLPSIILRAVVRTDRAEGW